MVTDPDIPEDRRTRDEPQSFRARALGASLTVKDLDVSLDFYQKAGFYLQQKFEEDGVARGASMLAGSVRIMLSVDDGKLGTDRVKGQGISLYFTTAQDIDKVAADIKTRGGALASEPADMPWGVRAFRLVDPDGFKIMIASEE